MRLLFLLPLLFIFFGFGSCSTIQQDMASPSLESNYPSVEIHACGQVWNGLAICSLTTSDSISSINPRIRGYNKGTLTIDSKSCGVHETIRYDDDSFIDIPHPETIPDKGCIYSFVLSPEFKREEDSGIRIYSMKGTLVLKQTFEDEYWKGFTTKVTGKFGYKIKLDIPNGQYNYILDKCGPTVKDKVDVNSSSLELEVSPAMVKDRCVLEVLLYDDNNYYQASVLYSIYDSKFTPYSIPNYYVKKNKIYFETDPQNSYISFDDNNKIGVKGKYKFNKNTPHIFRAATVKGRTIIGAYDYSTKEWSWKK